MKFNVYLLFFAFSIFYGCNEDKKNDKELTPIQRPRLSETGSQDTEKQPVSSASVNMEVKTFEVKDSLGNFQGWGYNIFIDNKRAIHQPIIPAVAGNSPFKTEEDARRTGLFALEKMKREGSLPTLSLEELDSLGITK